MSWIQFPDLTEDYAANCSRLKVTTQFAFCTTTPNTTAEVKAALIKADFKCVSSMNNWAHATGVHVSRQLDLWWYRSPKKQIEPCVCKRSSWNGGLKCRLQATGCGFALSDKLEHEHYWRFHTLMRMPVKPSARQLKWLARCHYFKLDEGELSSYWVNGFDPKTYKWQVERDYWTELKLGVDWSKSITPARFKRAQEKEKKLYEKQMAAYRAQYPEYYPVPKVAP